MIMWFCLCGIIKTISGFYTQFLAQSSKNPWNFLSDPSVCYANEVTPGGPLDSFSMVGRGIGAGPQRPAV